MSATNGTVVSPADDPRWPEVVIDCYGLERMRFAASGMTADLYRCRVNRSPLTTAWTTAPFLSWGGLNFDDYFDAAAAVQALRDELTRTGSGHVLLRDRLDRFSCLGDAAVFVDDQVGTFVLDLRGGPDRIFGHVLPGKTRNQIRKGERNGVSVRVGGAELLSDFHDVHARAWRDLGTPSHSPRYFRRILEVFSERAALLVGYHAGHAVSAALVLRIGHTLHHPYAATLREANSLCANSVLYWEIIRHGCERGAKRFDLGRSRPTQGTWRYKLSWGARPQPLYYTHVFLAARSVPARGPGRLVRAASRAWSRLPLGVTRLLGPHLIRWEL